MSDPVQTPLSTAGLISSLPAQLLGAVPRWVYRVSGTVIVLIAAGYFAVTTLGLGALWQSLVKTETAKVETKTVTHMDPALLAIVADLQSQVAALVRKADALDAGQSQVEAIQNGVAARVAELERRRVAAAAPAAPPAPKKIPVPKGFGP